MTVESEWIYFKNHEDWLHYCAKVDDRGRPFHSPWDKDHRDPPYNYFHDPEPLGYPCLGKAEFEDDLNGPYCMFYSYVYLSDMAYLLHVSLDDLCQERDKYKQIAVDLFILLAEVDQATAVKEIEKRVNHE